jgi:hypothetical protein
MIVLPGIDHRSTSTHVHGMKDRAIRRESVSIGPLTSIALRQRGFRTRSDRVTT